MTVAVANLVGTASDDGMPFGQLTYQWSGPPSVTFENPTSLVTRAFFQEAGVFALTLTASDGQLSTASTTMITVVPEEPSVCATKPLVVTGIRWPSSPTGRREVQWNSSNFSIESVNYKWNGGKSIAVFTDNRGCTLTVTK